MSSSLNEVSVIQILQTALPSSLLAEALTNSAAVVAEISSEFAAGETPTWFEELPTNVQTYLVPVEPSRTSQSVVAYIVPTTSASSGDSAPTISNLYGSASDSSETSTSTTTTPFSFLIPLPSTASTEATGRQSSAPHRQKSRETVATTRSASDGDTSTGQLSGGTGSSTSSSNTGAIAGGVVGGVAGLTLLIGVPIAVLKYRKRRQRREAMDEISAQPAVRKTE